MHCWRKCITWCRLRTRKIDKYLIVQTENYSIISTSPNRELCWITKNILKYLCTMWEMKKRNVCYKISDVPGGTGKTFLMNLLLASVRKDKNIAVAVASSGIHSAATLCWMEVKELGLPLNYLWIQTSPRLQSATFQNKVTQSRS